MNLLEQPQFNHRTTVEKGILEEECAELLRSFFKEIREKKKAEKQGKIQKDINLLK